MKGLKQVASKWRALIGLGFAILGVFIILDDDMGSFNVNMGVGLGLLSIGLMYTVFHEIKELQEDMARLKKEIEKEKVN